MPSYVLDASALLALLHQEPGSDVVTSAIQRGAAISTVNVAEVVSKLSEFGTPEATIRNAISVLGLLVFDFSAEFAYHVGALRPLTKQAGLSLGDRACLVLAHHLNLPVLTTDRVWESLSLGVTVRVIR